MPRNTLPEMMPQQVTALPIILAVHPTIFPALTNSLLARIVRTGAGWF